MGHDGLCFWINHPFLNPTVSEPTQGFEMPVGETEVQRGAGTWAVSWNESLSLLACFFLADPFCPVGLSVPLMVPSGLWRWLRSLGSLVGCSASTASSVLLPRKLFTR